MYVWENIKKNTYIGERYRKDINITEIHRIDIYRKEIHRKKKYRKEIKIWLLINNMCVRYIKRDTWKEIFIERKELYSLESDI